MKSLYTTITEDTIKDLVDTFYNKVRADEQLGPIFNPILNGRWEPHLNKLYAFWSSILLTSKRYHGNPIRQHYMVQNLKPHDFNRWLELFQETLSELFAPEQSQLIYRAAERMGERMQYALFVRPIEQGWINPEDITVAKP